MLESSVPEKLATAISSGIFFPSSLNLFIAPMANVSVKAKIALKGIFLQMGKKAAELILEKIKDPASPNHSIVLDAEIKMRASTPRLEVY